VEIDGEAAEAELDPAESRRLGELFDRQASGALSEAEQLELEALVSAYGRRLHERRLRELADQRGITLEEARRESAAQFDLALAWWHDFEADPERRATVVAHARNQRRQAAE
jgi:hypothetical protein